HGVAGLDRYPTAVEGDALADQRHVDARTSGPPGELDQPGRPRRSRSHGEDAAEPALGQLRLVQHGDPNAAAPAGRARNPAAEPTRRLLDAWGVDQVTGEGDRVGDDPRLVHRRADSLRPLWI